ncbi:MAG: YlbL family protein [Actinomycetota bacterium]
MQLEQHGMHDPPGAGRWPLAVAALALTAAGMMIAGWTVRLPFYAFSPGPVGDAVAAVEIGEVTTYQATDSLLMLTVSSQEVNPLEALVVAFDPTVDLVRREAVRDPDETDEEFVARNQANMDLSKETAITLALRRLGYEVTTSSDGVVVAEIIEGLPAASVLEVDDVIVSIDGEPVELPEQVGRLLTGKEPGSLIELNVLRGETELQLEVELSPRHDDPEVAMIGISAGAKNARFEYPFPIDIDAGLIGGPSAGMMYALAVIEVLTPGSLSAGRVVAGTGTIDTEGKVGGIGGVRQKVVAAEAAGADVMLVPSANYEEALTANRQTLELIPVSTLDEALSALASL